MIPILHRLLRITIGCSLLLVAGCGQDPPAIGDLPSRSPPPSRTEISFRDLALSAKRNDETSLQANQVVSDSDLVILEDMTMIETLLCDRGKVTDSGMKQVVRLENLQHLRLRFSPISDEGLATLANAKQLRFLNLPHCVCTASGIEQLRSLPQLQSLRLGSSRLEADAANAIASIKTLTSVHLIGVPIDDDGLKQIVSLPNLESLYLDDCDVTDEGWQWLFDNHPSLHVHVDQGHHDRDPTQH